MTGTRLAGLSQDCGLDWGTIGAGLGPDWSEDWTRLGKTGENNSQENALIRGHSKTKQNK
jgi:hypothetical protein